MDQWCLPGDANHRPRPSRLARSLGWIVVQDVLPCRVRSARSRHGYESMHAWSCVGCSSLVVACKDKRNLHKIALPLPPAPPPPNSNQSCDLLRVTSRCMRAWPWLRPSSMQKHGSTPLAPSLRTKRTEHDY